MELDLKNIGKIKTANVVIDGITVIAGENDTGKSTVSRALYSIFNSFYDIDNKIKQTRKDSIENSVFMLLRTSSISFSDMDVMEEVTNRILSLFQNSDSDFQTIEKEFRNIISDPHLEDKLEMDPNVVSEILNRIKEALELPDENVINIIINKSVQSEFHDQVSNIFTGAPGEIRLKIKDRDFAVNIDGNRVTSISYPGGPGFYTEAVYLDDSFVLDDWRSIRYHRGSVTMDHREQLRHKLLGPVRDANLIDEVLTSNKFKRIYEKVSAVCNGEVIRDKRTGLGLKRKNSDKVINIANLSTGIKTFVVLKELLENGILNYNGIILLDEPEVHLHPEWQLLFAEIIVLIHKEFGMHILLNTHSPYFLRAIQVFSAKHEVANMCRYYMSAPEGDLATITDVTNNIEEIYAKLSRPLQQLEDLRWQDD